MPWGKEDRTEMSQLVNTILLWHTLINVIQGSMGADQQKSPNSSFFFLYKPCERTKFSLKLCYYCLDLPSGRAHIAAPYLPYRILSLRDLSKITYSIFFFFPRLRWVQRGGAEGTGFGALCPPTQACQYSTWAMVTSWRKKQHRTESEPRHLN